MSKRTHFLAERGVVKKDQAAADWLESRGFRVDARNPLRVFADTLRSPGFEIARIRHTPARIAYGPLAPRAEGSRTIIQLEGETVCTSSSLHAPVFLAPGSSMLTPISSDIELNAAVPVARLEIRTDRRLPQVVSEAAAGVVTERTGYRPPLVALVNAAFSIDIDPKDTGFGDVRAAVEHLVSALFREHQPHWAPQNRQQRLHQDALALIRREARDPQLTVVGVAKRLGVSERTLRRTFAQHATSVRAEIARERADSAHAAIARGSARSFEGLHSIALSSGYTSIRSMRESLRRRGGATDLGALDPDAFHGFAE
ncbi:helix-turn-helix domain-containing protein [Microbacterium aurantiacum]|uniref:helix-turn-helix domain-containing protein n=1 Tax=Microbacterium aurantiacum TaxID=162393 RepID=UPI000C809C2E|nr:helix-turn-helix domain-containing protein [Microbacterium aurantiacum]